MKRSQRWLARVLVMLLLMTSLPINGVWATETAMSEDGIVSELPETDVEEPTVLTTSVADEMLAVESVATTEVEETTASESSAPATETAMSEDEIVSELPETDVEETAVLTTSVADKKSAVESVATTEVEETTTSESNDPEATAETPTEETRSETELPEVQSREDVTPQEVTPVDPSEAAGSFMLVVDTKESLIIVPELVYYRENMTIKDALKASGHTFVGIDEGYVTEIDGFKPESGFLVSTETGGWDASVQASTIKLFRYSTNFGEPDYQMPMSDALKALYDVMIEYLKSNEAQSDAAAKAAYDAAIADLPNISDEKATEHKNALRKALDDLNAAEKFTLTPNVTLGDTAVTDYDLKLWYANGTAVTIPEDGVIELLPGKYKIEVEKDYNAILGEFEMGSADQTLELPLPEGHLIQDGFTFRESWMNQEPEFASDTATGDLRTDFDPQIHEYTIFMPDSVTDMQLVALGQSGWYLYYTDAEGNSGGTKGVYGTGQSVEYRYAQMSNFASQYGSGGKKLRITVENKLESGLTQVQSYFINVERQGSLKDLQVAYGDTQAGLSFDEETKTYTALIGSSAESVSITPVIGGTAEAGYVIRVDDEDVTIGSSVDIPVTELTTEKKISVGHIRGAFTDYTLIIEKKNEIPVNISVTNEGATLTVATQDGKEVEPLENNIYNLVDQQAYVLKAEKDGFYATYDFLPEADQDIVVTLPDEKGFLENLQFGDKDPGDLILTPNFDVLTSSYTLSIPDTVNSASVWAKLNDELNLPASTKIEAVYTNLRNGVVRTVDVRDGSSYGSYLSSCTLKDKVSKPIDIFVSYTAEDEFTYGQQYHVEVLDTGASLEQVDSKVDGEVVQLTPDFEKDTLEYEIDVAATARELSIQAEVGRPFYELFINDEAVETGEPFTIELTNEENVVVHVKVVNPISNDEQIYKIKVNQLPLLQIALNTTPEDAIVNLTDAWGVRLWPDEETGKYGLLEGVKYNYVISRTGYITKKGQFICGGYDLNFVLEEAPVNENINEELEAPWPSFGQNNDYNAVIDYKTPQDANDANLYWATRAGEGFGSRAAGVPIVVGDYLVLTSSNKIFKMDRFTGEVLEEPVGEMVGSSSFSIVPPTYANGMIFVGLSGGVIQAFNAETLESLWVYRDPLGGQPNSPVTYSDGYVYTGFWTGENRDANFVCVSATDEDPSNPLEEKEATWRRLQKGGFYWAGAHVADDVVVVGTDDGERGYNTDNSNILSIDAKTGRIIDEISGLYGDLRSSMSYDSVTDRYYCTSKGGLFYSVALNEDGTFRKDPNGHKGYDLKVIKLGAEGETVMSTSTPIIYNGRAYIGVSGGSGHFTGHSGHSITVIDLSSWSIAYKAFTKGYCQTSGLLSTADEDGYVYVYFVENYNPGTIRYVKDKPGVTEVINAMTVEGHPGYAPVLWTPAGAQAQYAICTPIADEYGTLYFKNDSAYLMAVGNKITSIEVVEQPNKTIYAEGEIFDPTGMKVIAHLSNGLTRDVTAYVTLSNTDTALTADDTDVTVYYNFVMYGDKVDSETGEWSVNVPADKPETFIDITVLAEEDANAVNDVIDKIEAIGEVTLDSEEAITAARSAYDGLSEDLQPHVKNVDDLIAAEERLAELKKEAHTPTVTDLRVGALGKDVRITWTGDDRADGYKVYARAPGEEGMTEIADVTETEYSYTVTDLGYHFYQVYPYAEYEGETLIGGTDTYKYAKVVTGSVQNLQVENRYGRYNIVTWDAVEDAEGYVIYRMAPGEQTMSYRFVTQRTRYDDTVEDLGYYYYRVCAYHTEDGRMILGPSFTYVYAQRVLDPVTNLKATAETGRIFLSWDAMSEASDYVIYRRGPGEDKMNYLYVKEAPHYLDTRMTESGYYFYMVVPRAKLDGKMVAGSTDGYVFANVTIK